MKGGIYTDDCCFLCGKTLQHDENRDAFFCQCLPGKAQTPSSYRVKFGRKVHKRFKEYSPARQFLEGLRFKTVEGSFDLRDYKKENPLSFGKFNRTDKPERLCNNSLMRYTIILLILFLSACGKGEFPNLTPSPTPTPDVPLESYWFLSETVGIDIPTVEVGKVQDTFAVVGEKYCFLQYQAVNDVEGGVFISMRLHEAFKTQDPDCNYFAQKFAFKRVDYQTVKVCSYDSGLCYTAHLEAHEEGYKPLDI